MRRERAGLAGRRGGSPRAGRQGGRGDLLRGGPRGGLHDADLGAGDGGGLRWLEPEEVGEIAVRAILDDQRYAITHHDWLPVVEARHRAIEEAFTPPEL